MNGILQQPLQRGRTACDNLQDGMEEPALQLELALHSIGYRKQRDISGPRPRRFCMPFSKGLVFARILFCSCRSALKHAHDGSVAGLAADACNKLLVSGGYDGVLRIWAFKQRKLLHEIPVGRPISRLCHHSSSALLSVATDDLLIRM